MRVLLCSSLILGLLMESASAQAIPEGAYSQASGPVEMCGLKARGIPELLEQARASTDLQPVPLAGDRFELFANANHTYQLTFTRSGEAAYPAATCRHVFERDGSLFMAREMRCGAGKAECDALFIEFHNLDQRVRRNMRDGS